MYGKSINKIPQGIRKNTSPEEVTSMKLSREPCGIGTWVIGLFFELIQYGNMHPMITTNDKNPKLIMRLNNLKKLVINTFNVIAFILVTRSLASSIITMPINGKMKNTIPNIGVTWCEVTVTAIKDNEVVK